MAEKKARGPKKGEGGGKKANDLMRMLTPDAKMELRIKRELSELGGDYVAMVVLSPELYSLGEVGLGKWFMGTKNLPGIYVTVNRSFEDLKETLDKKGVDYEDVKFIDMISRMSSIRQPEVENCEYIDTPTDLTELMLTLEDKIDEVGNGEKFMLLDSLSGLLVYNGTEVVEKFTHSLIGKVREWKMKCVLLVVESEESRGVIHTIGQFCDRVSRFE